MIFILGVIIGILLSVLEMIVVLYFRRQMGTIISSVEKKITSAKGFIVEPKSDSEYARESIIRRNKSLGIDTKLSELQ